MHYDQLCQHPNLSVMTSEHGRLLAECGYGRRDSPLQWSDHLALTTTKQVTELLCQLRTEMIASYSGKHATVITHKMDGLSTSARRSLATVSTASILEDMQAMLGRLSSPRTYSPPSRWGLVAPVLDTPSWAPSLEHTAERGFLDFRRRRYSHGSTPTQPVTSLDVTLGDHWSTLEWTSPTPFQVKTLKPTASGK